MAIPVAFPFVGDTVGGSHVSAAMLMSHLPAFGYQPTALVHEEGPLIGWLKRKEIDVSLTQLPYVKVGGGIRAFQEIARTSGSLAFFLKKNEFQLVHANDARMINSWILSAKLAGIRSISHCRTVRKKSRISNWLHDRADRTIAISKFVQESLKREKVRCIHQIYNPFSPDSLVAETSQFNKSEIFWKGDVNIIFVGSLTAQKRPKVFIEAASLIHAVLPQARFWMFGRKTPYQQVLEKRVSTLGLSGVLTFAGFESNVVQFINKADLLVASAVDEGHGRALVEAMLLRTAVVASASGGHLEIVEDEENGLLFPIDDSITLAKKAVCLLQDQVKLNRILANAHNWAERTFSPHRHAEQVAGVYDIMLGR